MKNMRTVLTATMLFGLTTSLHASQEQLCDQTPHDTDGVIIEITESQEPVTMQRTASYDDLRDSWIKNPRTTFDNFGTAYGKKIYNIGSDAAAPSRWAQFATTITTVSDAKKWTAILEQKGNQAPDVWTPDVITELSTTAQEIIQADYQASIESSKEDFRQIQKAGRNLLLIIFNEMQKKEETRAAHKAAYQEQIETLKRQMEAIKQEHENKTKENIERYQRFIENSLPQVQELMNTAEQYKNKHNRAYPERQIDKPIFLTIKNITKQNLPLLAEKYAQRQAQLNQEYTAGNEAEYESVASETSKK